MGRKSKTEMAEVAIADELRLYYQSDGAAQGLSSSFAPLVNIANGGFGGSPDPERAIVRRHELGATATQVTRVRAVRAALRRLTAAQQSVLYAAFGPMDWPRAADAAFGRGMGQRVTKRLGALVGVALLTEAVRRGYEADREEYAKLGPAWRNAGGWLVSACITEDKTAAERVASEAKAMLAGAVSAYRAACAEVANAVRRGSAVPV